MPGEGSPAYYSRRLCVTEATVEVHVSHILAKLGLRDRAQVVVFAYENGVVQPGEPTEENPC
jgi:DNA-binding CsgD family transcriptional regulator